MQTPLEFEDIARHSPVTADALTAWAMMSSAFLVEVNGWFQPSM